MHSWANWNFMSHAQYTWSSSNFLIAFPSSSSRDIWLPLAVFGCIRVAQLVAPGSLPGRKWKENEKMKRKWRENEEMERKCRENEEMERDSLSLKTRHLKSRRFPKVIIILSTISIRSECKREKVVPMIRYQIFFSFSKFKQFWRKKEYVKKRKNQNGFTENIILSKLSIPAACLLSDCYIHIYHKNLIYNSRSALHQLSV